MAESVTIQSHDARSEGWTPLSATEFLQLCRSVKMEACARALAPSLSERPALMSSIVRDDATVVWCVGGLSPRDGVIDAFAVIPGGGGAIAAVVRDALPSTGAQRERPFMADTAAPASAPVLIDAPEAARLMGIKVPALWQRKQRGQLPPGSVFETGDRVQFHRERLLAGIAKRAR